MPWTSISDKEENVIADTTKDKPVEVMVNDTKVKIHSPASGEEIKQAAIEAGVRIKTDYILMRERANEPAEQIADDQKIDLKDGDVFTANDGDDNS